MLVKDCKDWKKYQLLRTVCHPGHGDGYYVQVQLKFVRLFECPSRK